MVIVEPLEDLLQGGVVTGGVLAEEEDIVQIDEDVLDVSEDVFEELLPG